MSGVKIDLYATGVPAHQPGRRCRYLHGQLSSCNSKTPLPVPSTLNHEPGPRPRRMRPDAGLDLCAWRRREFQAVFLPKLNHPRDVLLLLGTQRADFFKESFEARRRDDAHEPAGRLAKITVSMRYAARRENRRAFLGDERFPAHRPLVFPFQDLERLVLAMMNVWRRAATRHVMRLNRADDATRVATVDANVHQNAEDVYFLASVGWNLDWLHKHGHDVLPFSAGWQDSIIE